MFFDMCSVSDGPLGDMGCYCCVCGGVIVLGGVMGCTSVMFVYILMGVRFNSITTGLPRVSSLWQWTLSSQSVQEHFAPKSSSAAFLKVTLLISNLKEFDFRDKSLCMISVVFLLTCVPGKKHDHV